MQYDVFVCHASEDKKDFVEPLVKALVTQDLRVWYDRFELSLGDSLREKIDEGLNESSYGVVVLSRAFFEKKWPKEELDGLIARQTSEGKKVILPVWYKVGSDEVRKFSPILAGKVAAKSDEGIGKVAERIMAVVRGPTPEAEATVQTSVRQTCRQAIEQKDVMSWQELVDKSAGDIVSHLRNLIQANESLFRNEGVDLPPHREAREKALRQAVTVSVPSLVPILSAIQAGKEDYWKESVRILLRVARLGKGMMDSDGSATDITRLVLYVAGAIGMALIAKTRQLHLARQWAMLKIPNSGPTRQNEVMWWQVPAINGWGQRTHNGGPYAFLVSVYDDSELTGFFESNNTFRKLLFVGNLLMSMVEFADRACKTDYDDRLKQGLWLPKVVPMWSLMPPADFQSETLRIFKSGQGVMSFAYPDCAPEADTFWRRWQAWKRKSVTSRVRDAADALTRIYSLRLPDEPTMDS